MPARKAEAMAAVWPSLEAHVRDILDFLPTESSRLIPSGGLRV